MSPMNIPAGRGYWDGAFHSVPDVPTFVVCDPASGAELARLPTMGAVQAQLAVDSAARRLAEPPDLETRARWLEAIAEALIGAREALAATITAENGKPLAEARGEVDYAAAFYRDAALRVPAMAPTRLPTRPRGLSWEVHHRPAGVAALITPWNFPLAMLAKKLAGALAAGCPAVVKPAEKTPLTCIAFFELLHELGLPAGQVNLVYGDAPAIGRVFCEHPSVRVLSFTGSTAVGRTLAAWCAPGLKRLSLELGGNAPLLVFEDADLVRAADALMANKFRCAGQTCVCTNRVLVADGVAEEFTALVAERVAALSVGPGGSDDPVDVGPLIDLASRDKVLAHVRDALQRGARIVVGTADAPSGAGAFATPTVLADVAPDARCLQEEVFGPLVPIVRFTDEAEAVRMANDTEYGLAAYVFSGDPARLARVAAALHFGHVGLDTTAGPTPEAPFGGMQQSGHGREGGLEGVMEFVELQTCPARV